MIIAIEYKNGRMKEFDTSAFTTTNAMSAGDRTARNVLTELDLRLDLVDKVGLRLDFYWYDATPQGQSIKIDGLTDSMGNPVCLTSASRRLGTSVLLCSREGIKQISRIIVQRANGTANVLWRQGSGDWLINGARFEAQRVLTYTDSNVSSTNSQAVFVFKYMKELTHRCPIRQSATLSDTLLQPTWRFRRRRQRTTRRRWEQSSSTRPSGRIQTILRPFRFDR